MVYIFFKNDMKIFLHQVKNINTNKHRLDLITFEEIKLITKQVKKVKLLLL
jgi:hypothetical protein